MNIGFFLDKANLEKVDCSRITEGNPGMGGSEYEFLLVSYLLEQRNNGIEPVLLTRSKINAPHNNVISIRGGIEDVCKICIDNHINLLVINQGQFDPFVFDKYSTCLNLILWAHNIIPYSKLTIIEKRAYIKRIVCCGREMLELFRDHPVSMKSTYVYNIFPMKSKDWYMSQIDFSDNHNVVYMGMLHPGKGFQVLARSWKSILKKVPDAQLYVIGNGQLYDKNARLGRYGLATEEFENIIMPYLEDTDGNLLPSVHFMGLLGTEKWGIMGKCKVGVPNPTGRSETFCICGIEMQLCGCNIVTIRHFAYLDTIFNQIFLYRKCTQFVDYIVKGLLAPRTDYTALYHFISDKFSMEKSLTRWEELLSIENSMKLEPISSIHYQMKWLKDKLLHAKMALPILKIIPPIEKFYNFYRDKISKYNQ